jgi:uncharacterized phage protein (TIGR01671 family)
MREILFRGKRKDFDNEWLYGFYTLYNNNRGMKPTIITGTEENCCILLEVIPETIGQYTGLTDKNGKKIFEGDIVLYGFTPCVVKFDTDNARFMLYENGKYLKNGFNVDTMKLKEVIGNIHDNPELLKGGAEQCR